MSNNESFTSWKDTQGTYAHFQVTLNWIYPIWILRCSWLIVSEMWINIQQVQHYKEFSHILQTKLQKKRGVLFPHKQVVNH